MRTGASKPFAVRVRLTEEDHCQVINRGLGPAGGDTDERCEEDEEGEGAGSGGGAGLGAHREMKDGRRRARPAVMDGMVGVQRWIQRAKEGGAVWITRLVERACYNNMVGI